jgi:hypothetical protein
VEGETAKGVLVSDNFRLVKDDDSTMVKEFPFLLVNYWTQSQFEKVEGVIGLSKTYFSLTGERSGPEFLEQMF